MEAPRRRPATITINGGPWAGVYTPRGGDAYYPASAPAQAISGTDRRPLPAIHFTIDPDRTDWGLHLTVEIGGFNAHLWWNRGNDLRWDIRLPDTERALFDAVYAADDYAAHMVDALQQVWDQLEAGTTPDFVPTSGGDGGTGEDGGSGGSGGGYAYDDADFPPLGLGGASQGSTGNSNTAPTGGPGGQYGATDSPSTADEFASGGAASGEGSFSLFSVPPEVTLGLAPIAYVDEIADGQYLFAVSDGRSFRVEQTVLQDALAGTLYVAQDGPWVVVVIGDQRTPLPEALFEITPAQ